LYCFTYMKIIKTLAFCMLFVFVGSCSYSDEFHTIQEPGHFSIEFPEYIDKLDGLSNTTPYQYGNLFRNFYIIIEEAPLAKFPSVEAYAQTSVNELLNAGTLSSPDTLEIKQLKDFNGLSGRHLILTADVGEGELFKPILYHLLHLKSEDRYYHLVLWTWAEWEEKYEATIPRILKSFKGSI